VAAVIAFDLCRRYRNEKTDSGWGIAFVVGDDW
jgi:hypothetical protein